ncbi:MAG TPA: cyanase [Actinomycetota bacterium]|nr:cyanase [Actinomycetota bacterium]
MDRERCNEVLAEARRRKGLTYEEIAGKLGRHAVWTAAAMLGQATLDAEEAAMLVSLLELEGDEAREAEVVLQEPPSKGALGMTVPTDPLMYRLHEITQVYGPAIKAVIHERFGDGIMSAIDFEIDIERVADPKGDRVKLVYNGKFLPYRKW